MVAPLRTEKRPTTPVPENISPPGVPHTVTDGEDWASVARLAGVDLWDLIDFNFKTRDPGVVNWYLREYVGCVIATPDHNNWKFSSGLNGGRGAWKGGKIWLPRKPPPPAPAPPPPDLTLDCTKHPVAPPKVVAIAKEPGLIPRHKFADPDLPAPPPDYGEDLTFGMNGVAPNGENVGSAEAELRPKMWHLLDYFAWDDNTGMARRLFTKFLAKQGQITMFADPDLDKAAAAHENIQDFCFRAMSGPPRFAIQPPPGKSRIHQALKAAKWNINNLVAPTDLGAPAFNLGRKYSWLGWGDSTRDWANGLGVMIDAVQYVYVVATHYHYNPTLNWYCIRLKFMGYDVFGLGEDDVDTYGAKKDNSYTKFGEMGVGITAWWQLQHQYGYAPVVTRFVVEKAFAYPAN